MDIAAIGVGGAGSRVVDHLARENGTTGQSILRTVHAVETDRSSLQTLTAVPEKNRHLVGQFETDGEGTAGDRSRAKAIAEAEGTELRRTVDGEIPTTVDAVVLVAGLAGGTGSAITGALAAGLDRIYEQPVYAVSILPADDDTAGREKANTVEALKELSEHATAQIVFDNDVWLRGDMSIASDAEKLNGELVSRLTQLFTLGTESTGNTVGQRVIDSQDVLTTLDAGEFVSIGYASKSIASWRGADTALVDRLKRRVFGDDTDDFERAKAVRRTTIWATRGLLTFDCPRAGASHGLVAFRGPPAWLRSDALTKSRGWFADRTGVAELRTGDIPIANSDSLDVLVLLTGIGETPRIEQLRKSAAKYSEDPEPE